MNTNKEQKLTPQQIEDNKKAFDEFSNYSQGLYKNKVMSYQLGQFLHLYISNQLTEQETKKALKMLCDGQ